MTPFKTNEVIYSTFSCVINGSDVWALAQFLTSMVLLCVHVGSLTQSAVSKYFYIIGSQMLFSLIVHVHQPLAEGPYNTSEYTHCVFIIWIWKNKKCDVYLIWWIAWSLLTSQNTKNCHKNRPLGWNSVHLLWLRLQECHISETVVDHVSELPPSQTQISRGADGMCW